MKDVKNYSYCNYCKNFCHYDGFGFYWITNRDAFGPGYCKILKECKYFFMTCDDFIWDPLKNQYNLESPDYVKDWNVARAFQSDMYHDVLDEQSRKYRAKGERLRDLSQYIETRKRAARLKNKLN